MIYFTLFPHVAGDLPSSIHAMKAQTLDTEVCTAHVSLTLRFGAAESTLYITAPDISAPGLSGARFFFQDLFSVATLFPFVARFARGRIEDSSFNRFALNGIQEITCFIVISS